MTETADNTIDSPLAPVRIDAFNYFDGVASKIRGLGGSTIRPEINYGFHTLYVRCAPGRRTMTVRITGLSATSGTLILQVNMLSVVPGSHAKIAMMERFTFAEIVAADGEATVQFESLRGQIYALYGKIEGETDAVAASLVIELDRLGKEEDELDPARKIAPVLSSAANVRAAERLASTAEGTFVDPVSQGYSARQTREGAYHRRAQELGEATAPSVSQWMSIYPFQVLDRYGALKDGARGLHVGTADPSFFAVLERYGCALEHRSVDELRAGRQTSGLAEVTDDPFDFLWTGLLAEQFDTVATLLSFAESLMAQLRPGGLAVLMVRFLRDADGPAAWSAGKALNRGDVERLALNLVSRNHEISQLKFAVGKGPDGPRRGPKPTAFGIIARRR